MDPITIGSLIGVGKEIISRVWPDPQDQAEELRKLEELRQKGDLAHLDAHIKSLLGQLEINKIDASSGSKFQAWWRPAVGWVGAVSLALMYIPKAIVMTYIWTYQSVVILSKWGGEGAVIVPDFPDLGVSDIIGLLMSMLGIAAMRSYDKKQGTDTKK